MPLLFIKLPKPFNVYRKSMMNAKGGKVVENRIQDIERGNMKIEVP